MKVLMIGAGRDVRGGVSSVVNGYYDAGLDKLCELTYLPTMEDGPKLKKLFVAVCARIKFESLIKKNDILHVHMSSDSSFYRKAIFIQRAYRAGKKIIIHMHGSTFDVFFRERCSNRQKQKVKDVFRMADKVIALSEDWRVFLAENICAHEKIEVLYNAVPIPAEYDKDYQNQDILFLGKLGHRKGTYDLVDVLPQVFAKHPHAHAYLGGDGEAEKVREYCQKKGILDRVTFLGWVRDKEKEQYLKKCSIYILPSYHEGMPMSVLEAMAYGLAVISTYVGGIPHLLEHGTNGLLCRPGDKEMLAKLTDEVLEKGVLREQLGKRARKTIEEKFDVNRNVQKLLEFYRQLS